MTKRSSLHRIHQLEQEIEGLRASRGLLQDILAALCLRDTGKLIVTAEELHAVEQYCGTSGGIQWTEVQHGGKPAIMVELTKASVGALAAGAVAPEGLPS